MTRAGRRAFVQTCAAAVLGGCALPAPEPVVTTSLIDQLPADLPHPGRAPLTLLVLAPQARPAYDTPRMAYSLRPHHLAYYSRNAWAESPPQMLKPLLVRALEATGRFQAVLVPPHAGASTHSLQVDVLELLQDFETQPPVLRVVLHAQLADAAQRVLASREFVARQPLAEASPAGGVRAANEAMARVVRELAVFVVEQAR
ncbi:ABC-type transport auxiliary lipoprotein family protein [Ramlibacter alkalitolerans]|uniref:Membrane integrity-associated transporter subunit PqiC n=1 Tax=Ramlibacter alkalitolerans TaxID=2039631 RepID=A0ABS1JUA8_9BURK|nr:ABC-type transport auxiliary lipoprotein family protein [Ramlibacter alkalitolerans]MBL0427441.1 membrane integrity-associated transporter subunit PqiC [Ramlibacter alkalitolerans]